MQENASSVYQRRKYRLDKLKRADGTIRSPRWYIFWYDPEARREASVSTGTTEVGKAKRALDAKYLNDAGDADTPRSERRPIYKPLPCKQVSRPRRVRVDVPVLADMLAYAAETDKKRVPLHAFIVASLCTVARPDSIVDICIAPHRE